MKKLIVFGIVACMVMGLAGVASAAITDNWMIMLSATDQNDQNGSDLLLAGSAGALDGFDLSDTPVDPPSPTAANIVIKSLIGSSGYGMDQQSAFTDVGQIRTWTIVAVPDGSNQSTAYKFSATEIVAVDPGIKVQLFSVVGQTKTLVWDLANNGYGNVWVTAPAFTAGSRPSYNFELVASTAVPEPGSMVAMLSGLIGLVGYGIRRRK